MFFKSKSNLNLMIQNFVIIWVRIILVVNCFELMKCWWMNANECWWILYYVELVRYSKITLHYALKRILKMILPLVPEISTLNIGENCLYNMIIISTVEFQIQLRACHRVIFNERIKDLIYSFLWMIFGAFHITYINTFVLY